jgi:hypothetical protein
MTAMTDMLPFYTRDRKVNVNKISVVLSPAVEGAVEVVAKDVTLEEERGKLDGYLVYSSDGVEKTVEDFPVTLEVKNNEWEIDEMWVVVEWTAVGH